MVFKPEINLDFLNDFGETLKRQDNQDEVEVVNASANTTESQAKKTAVKQFKNLGETVKEDDLQIMKIQRKGEEYYYVTSKENTLEIKISTGKVTRINSVVVEE